MRIVFWLTFVFSTVLIQAQTGKVSGKIIDKDDQTPVPFCNVVLYSQNDSIVNGTIAEENGSFSITEIPFGKYYISFQSLAHSEFKTEIFDLNAKTTKKSFSRIELTTSGIVADEVTIEVERAAVKIEPAKKTFDVKATGADAGGTAVDVLNNLPSVDVDDAGTVSLRGNSNIRVLIDGKPAGFTADDITVVINQLPANSIETIEVITVPSAKYDPEGIGGIINIVLKKEKKKGYQGNTNISYSTYDKVNAQISLNLNKNKWSLNTSYSYADGTYWNRRTSDGLYALPDSFTIFQNYKDGIRRKPSHNANLNIGYAINKTTKLSVEGNLTQMYFLETDSSDFLWNYNDESIDFTERTSHSNGNRLGGTGQVSLSSKTKKGNSFIILSRVNGANNPRENTFIESYLLQKENKQFEAQTWVNQLDATFPILKADNDTVKGKYFTLESGLKSANRGFKEDYTLAEFSPSLAEYNTLEEFTNNLDYGENVYAAYGLVNFGNKKIQFSTGLRAEYSEIISKTSLGDYSKNLFNLFPSASIVKNYSETKSLTISYSKRIKRPQGGQLNPIPSYSDPFTLRQGNADLVPEKSHMSEISYLNIGNKLVFNGTLFHQYRDDRIGRLSFTDSAGVSTILWSNFNYHQTLGLELFTNYKFNKWLKSNMSATFYNTWVDGENFREGYYAEYFGYDLKANFQFKLSEKTNLTWTGDFNSSRLAVVGKVIPRGGSDLSLKHKVLKSKGAVSLRLTDVFRTRRFGINVDTDGWFREVRYRYESQLVWIGFNYSFGQTVNKSGNKKFKRESRSDSDY